MRFPKDFSGCRITELALFEAPCRGRGGVSKTFYTGKLRPEVQLLTLLYTIFHEKGTPFVYLLLTNDTSFTYIVQL